jgi:hypothetical protein
VPVFLGGLVRWFGERMGRTSDTEKADIVERGILAASGLIAGESLIGILLAVLVSFKMKLPANPLLGGWASLILYLLLALWLGWVARKAIRVTRAL